MEHMSVPSYKPWGNHKQTQRISKRFVEVGKPAPEICLSLCFLFDFYISLSCVVRNIPRTAYVQKLWASLNCGLITEIFGFVNTHPTFYRKLRQKPALSIPSLNNMHITLLGVQKNWARIWEEMLQTTWRTRKHLASSTWTWGYTSVFLEREGITSKWCQCVQKDKWSSFFLPGNHLCFRTTVGV